MQGTRFGHWYDLPESFENDIWAIARNRDWSHRLECRWGRRTWINKALLLAFFFVGVWSSTVMVSIRWLSGYGAKSIPSFGFHDPGGEALRRPWTFREATLLFGKYYSSGAKQIQRACSPLNWLFILGIIDTIYSSVMKAAQWLRSSLLHSFRTKSTPLHPSFAFQHSCCGERVTYNRDPLLGPLFVHPSAPLRSAAELQEQGPASLFVLAPSFNSSL